MSSAAFDRVSVYRVAMPLFVPYRLAFGPVTAFDTLIVEIVDREGRTGFGEATILTGYTDETIEDAWRTAAGFVDRVHRHGAMVERDIAEMGKRLPFTATAFGTALDMLRGSDRLVLDRDAAV